MLDKTTQQQKKERQPKFRQSKRAKERKRRTVDKEGVVWKCADFGAVPKICTLPHNSFVLRLEVHIKPCVRRKH